MIFIFVVLRQFSQHVGEWPENQILIPDWTNFHCPGATLPNNRPQDKDNLAFCRTTLRGK